MDKETEKLITIVLPVYNRASIVMRTLASIEAQSSRDFRLVIVDNGSSDNTYEVLTKWVESHRESSFSPILLREPKPGASAARNCGLAEVMTEYVMYFDSDDEMRPNHIARISDHLRRFPQTDLLRWDISMIDSDGWLSTTDKRFHDEMQLHLMHGTLATQRFAVRTSIAKSIGGWNEQLKIYLDLEIGVRLIATGCKISKLNGEPTVVVHHSEECISGNSYSSRTKEIAETLDAIEKILREGERAEDMPILNAKRAIVAGHLKRENNHEEWSQFLQKSLESASRKERLYQKIVFWTVRILGKGGCFVALKLMGKKAEKR